MPAVFGHTVVVPGLVNLAQPAFPQVDADYENSEYDRMLRSVDNGRSPTIGDEKMTRANPAGARVFNVLNYGAVADDKTDNTDAFSACVKAGEKGTTPARDSNGLPQPQD